MMKWGRRRKPSSFSSSASASRPPFMSHASLFSWLSKFKHMRINNSSEPNHGKMKHKAKQNPTPTLGCSSPQYSCGNVGGDYEGDGDALRRSSFGEEIHDHKDKENEDIDDEKVIIPSSSFSTGRRNANKKHGTREGTHLKFKEKDIIGVGEERKLQDDRKVISSHEMDECNREKEYEHLRSRFERKAQRVLQEQLLKIEKTEEGDFASEKDVLMQLESPITLCTPRTNSPFASFADSSSGSNFKVRRIVDCHEKAGRQLKVKKHGTREGTLIKFKENKDRGLGDERKLLDDKKVSMDEYNREKEYEHLRSRFETKAQRVLQEQLLKLEKEAAEVEFSSSKVVEKDVLMQLESPRTICTPRTHSSFASFADSSSGSNFKVRSIVDCYEKAGRLQSQKKSSSSERKNLKQTEELKVKTNNKKRQQTLLDVIIEPQRMRKPKQHSPRLRIYSPRMASKVEVCRIKAIQDMRKAKQKMKRLEREEVVEEIQGPDHSLAVIKCSLDPKQDFRDSIVEMIMEKHIRHPEEMEELLACYLALNADEYHDLIIRVFRQVWFDMSQDGLGIKSNVQCS